MRKMKMMLFLAAALSSVSAFALPTVSDSWDAIRSYPGISVMPATAYDSNFGPAGIFNACVDGNVLRNINPLHQCTNFVRNHQGPAGRDSTDGHCVNHYDYNVSVPLQQKVETCTSWIRRDRDERSCAQYQTVTYTIPLNYNLQVSYSASEWGSPVNLFTKPYTLPNCHQ